MSFVAVGTTAVGLYSAHQSGKAGQDAANAQGDASMYGIDEQRRQFDAIQKLLAPYIQGGTDAFGAQQDLLGLNGMDAQGRAIQGIENSPQFAEMFQQGENAMLQNASATGGLRGGNIQEALAKFRPSLLNGLIDQQYQRLGGIASMGQSSAVQQGEFGANSATNIGKLFGEFGASQAGGILSGAKSQADMFGQLGKFGGYVMGNGGF